MKIVGVKSKKDGNVFMEKIVPVAFKEDTAGLEPALINIIPEVSYQTIEGFGGAFTEAASSTLDLLGEENREKVLRAYFDPQDGIGYSLCRTHINSCDFSTENYAYTEDGDMTLESFDMERDKKSLMPMILDAKRYGTFKLFASPWSPPAYMKSNKEMNHGGRLLPECYGLWADYVVKYIETMRASGIEIWAVTVQNEAKATQTWDSCVYTPEEERDFVRDYLGPKLAPMGVKIFFWDHNKERIYDRAKVMLSDEAAAQYVEGIAIHWYSGGHFEQLQMFHELYPDKKIIFSEGCFGFQPIEEDGWFEGEGYAYEIINDLKNHCTAFCDWNMLLNLQGGPNHVQNFSNAPVMADTEKNMVYFRPSFYYLGHFSKYIRPGAVRIGSSGAFQQVSSCAFRNPDGSIVLVVLNQTETCLEMNVRLHGQLAPIVAEPLSIATYIIQ